MSNNKKRYCLGVCASVLVMVMVQAQEQQFLTGKDALVPVAAPVVQESAIGKPAVEQPLVGKPAVEKPAVQEVGQKAVDAPVASSTVSEKQISSDGVNLAALPLEPVASQAATIPQVDAAPAVVPPAAASVPQVPVESVKAPVQTVDTPVAASAPIPSEDLRMSMPHGDTPLSQVSGPEAPALEQMVEARAPEQTPMTVIPPALGQQQEKPVLTEPVLDEPKTAHEKNVADYAYLGQFLKPWELIERDKLIEINFENAQLMNLIDYFEHEYGIKFILDNVIEPMAEGGKNPVGIRFSFKTEKPLNKKQAWDLFVAFLDMAGLMIVPGPTERVYQITNNKADSRFSASKEPIPTFVGIDQSLLPTSDIKIRYVYFIQNTTVDTVKSVVEKLRSPISSPPILVGELNALILTDRASNVQTILTILKELDKPVLPETLVVLRLKKTEAEKVKTLYDNLVNEEKNLFPRLAPWARKQSVGYFTENVRLVADKRTNSLIILGPRNNVKKIEDFITKEIDREIDLPYSPLHVYPLKFIDAAATAQIINDLKAGFQSATTAGQTGGLIGGTRFIKPTVTITAEKLNNSLIINADYDDYLQIYELLEKIDIEQPQVAIRILVLDVTLTDTKKLGMQMRTPVPFMGDSTTANFQNSGLPISDTSDSTLVQHFNTTDGKANLLGDLINLIVGQEAGSTILTLPSDAYGVYGILKALQKVTNVSVIAKPFLVTSHKYNASINIAETRRVTTATIVGGSQTQNQYSQGDLSAGLSINLSPQISPDNYVTLDVTVTDSQFTAASSTSQADTATGNRNEKSVKSSVILGDNQVLALGGIIIDRELETIFKVPLLGDIPLLGWFFKSKTKVMVKTSLLILISAQIVRPQSQDLIDGFTDQRLSAAKGVLARMDNDNQKRDVIHRWFFNDHDKGYQNNMDKILSIDEQKKALPSKVQAVDNMPDPVIKKAGRITHDDRVKGAVKHNDAVAPVNQQIPETPIQKIEQAKPESPVTVDVPSVTVQSTASPAAAPADKPIVSETTLMPAPEEHVSALPVSTKDQATVVVGPVSQKPETPIIENSVTDNHIKTEPAVSSLNNNRRRLRAFVPSTGGADAS